MSLPLARKYEKAIFASLIYVGASKRYRGVYAYKNFRGIHSYLGAMHKCGKRFKTEKEAARYVDIVLISLNKEPVNILKRI